MRSPLEVCHKPIQDHEPDNARQNILEIEPETGGHLESGADVDLFHIIIKSPAVLPCTEKSDNHRADRQHEVADEEILEVHDAVAFTQRLNKTPDIEAQRARDRADGNENAVYEG